jgi:hypothetical protein
MSTTFDATTQKNIDQWLSGPYDDTTKSTLQSLIDRKELTTLTYKKTSVASEKPAQITSTEIKPTVNKPVARKKHVIPPVDAVTTEPPTGTTPITTTLQGNEFASPAPRQAGMPSKEEPAMMEQKIIHLKF